MLTDATAHASGTVRPMVFAMTGHDVAEAWMADEVQDYLTSEIETLRSAVFRAGVLNARTPRHSAEKHLGNVLRLVAISNALEDATFLTVTRIAFFVRTLHAPAAIGEIDKARRDALGAIDALAVVLEGSTTHRPAGPERHVRGDDTRRAAGSALA